MSHHDRATWIARWTAAGFAVALLLTRKLWLTDRLYPLTPVAEWLPPIPSPLDAVIHAALAVLCVVIALAPPRRIYLVAVSTLYLVYSLWDQEGGPRLP